MKFTKANNTFAQKRGLELDIDYDLTQTVSIYEKGECEPLLVYTLDTDKEELFFSGQLYGDKIEDLPAWIATSKQLNSVVAYVASELGN